MSSRSRAVLLLQVFALTLFVIPSDTVIPAIGAGGYPAGLIGMFAFAAFLSVTLLGLHNPLGSDIRYVPRSACSGCPSSPPTC